MTAEVAKALADSGPWAVVLLLGGLAIFSLWREHLKADAEDRRQRDDNYLLARDAVDGLRRLAAAQEARLRREEKQSRHSDKP